MVGSVVSIPCQSDPKRESRGYSKLLHVNGEGTRIVITIITSLHFLSDRPEEGLSTASAVLTITTALAFAATTCKAWIGGDGKDGVGRVG